jgi:hypothetical protein
MGGTRLGSGASRRAECQPRRGPRARRSWSGDGPANRAHPGDEVADEALRAIIGRRGLQLARPTTAPA